MGNAILLFTVIFLYLFIPYVDGFSAICKTIDIGAYSTPDTILFAALSIILAVIVRVISQKIKLPIPHAGWTVIIGILIGTTANFSSAVRHYTATVEVNSYDLLAVILPLIVFKTAYFVDTHSFVRSWAQILLISTVGVFVNATITGFTLSTAKLVTWTFPMLYMFGAACTPIHPHDIVAFLRDMGYQVKHLVTLLEAESMVGLAATILLFNLMDDMVQKKDTDVSHVFLMVAWSLLLGPLVGWILGKFVVIMIELRSNDIISIMLWTISSAYFGYYVCEQFIDCSAVLCVCTIGVIMGFERHGFTMETDQVVSYFWELLSSISYTLLLFITSIFCGRNVGRLIKFKDFAAILVTYIVVHISRFASLIVMAPLLSKLGYGFTFNKLVIMLWSDIKGAVAASLASIGFGNLYREFGITLCVHTTGLLLLTLFINVPTLQIILQLLDMSQLTLARMNNMDTCVRYILSRREHSISMLKMDRFLSDANWPLVQKATVIKHPYKIHFKEAGVEDQDETHFGYRQTKCPDCQKEVVAEPTPKEMHDMTREARQRILKAKKISYIRQYENRLLSKDAIRVLSTTVELAANTKEALIKLDGLYKLFHKQGMAYHTRKFILKMFYRKSKILMRKPRTFFRICCYHIIRHLAFDIIIAIINVGNLVVLVLQLVWLDEIELENEPLDIAAATFTTVYMLQFILKIYGSAHQSLWRDGIKTYFRSYWNLFEFCLLLTAIAQSSLELAMYYYHSPRNTTSHEVVIIVNITRILLLMKLLPFFKAWYPKLVKWCDSRIDADIAFAYELGKGFVNAEQEILEKLPQMIENSTIREDMRKRMDKDRMGITRELGIIQKDMPWIAITVKTKQAMRSTISSMLDAVAELKLSGWVDDFEFTVLSNLLQERLKYIHKMQSIQPSEPKVIFSEVPWMKGDATVSNFLYQNVRNKVYDEGDFVCKEGDSSEGIFIVITGILKLSYNSDPTKVANFYQDGVLPIIDYIANTNYEIEVEDYIVTGNTVGVLATLTDRPYDCNIIAETPSQVFVLKKSDVKKAIKASTDPVHGVESKMWKEATLALALFILSEVPAYQSLTKEKMRMVLDRGFVPNLSNYKILTVTDMIQDIILLEGVVTDYVTRENYLAPCHIPRTIQRIILPKSSQAQIPDSGIEVKLMIIPINDIDVYELMVSEEEISELVSMSVENCLQHLIQNRLSLGRKRRRKPAQQKVSEAKRSEMMNEMAGRPI